MKESLPLWKSLFKDYSALGLTMLAGMIGISLCVYAEHVLCSSAQCSFALIAFAPGFVAAIAVSVLLAVSFWTFRLIAAGGGASNSERRRKFRYTAVAIVLGVIGLVYWSAASTANHLVCNSPSSLHWTTVELLRALVRDAPKFNVRYTVINGAVLGAVRSGKLIPHDLDLDVYIPDTGDNMAKFHELVRWWLENDVMGIEGSHSLHLKMNPPLFGVFQWSSLDYYVWADAKEDLVDKLAPVELEDVHRMFDTGGNCTLEGLTVSCPDRVEQFLAYAYGPNWRTPSRARRGEQISQFSGGIIPGAAIEFFCSYAPII